MRIETKTRKKNYNFLRSFEIAKKYFKSKPAVDIFFVIRECHGEKGV